MDVKAVAKALFDRTQKWAEEHYKAPENRAADTEGLSERARKCNAIINKGGFGCQTEGVRLLTSALLDEKLPKQSRPVAKCPPLNAYQMRRGLILRMLDGSTANNSHSYGDNSTVMIAVDGSFKAYNSNKVAGNNINQYPDFMRPATLEECEEYVAAVGIPLIESMGFCFVEVPVIAPAVDL